MNHPRVRLIVLLLLSLLLRIGWGIAQRSHPDPRLGDQFEYLSLGRNLLHHGELKFHDARFDDDVYAYRTPGYPVFVALCGGNVTAIRIAQALLDTLTVLAVYLLARRWLSPNGSLVAALFVAFNPFLVFFSALVLSETLFTALLAWGVCLLVRPRPIALIGGMILLAVSVQVRPSALGLAVLLPALIGATWPRRLAHAALAGVMVLAVLLPWAWRNHKHPELRAWIFTTTNGGITTYDGFHEGATGASDQEGFLKPMLGMLSRLDEVERDAYLSAEAHEWIQTHPRQSLGLMGRKIIRTWSPLPLSSEYGRTLYRVVGLCFAIPFDLLILLGLWRSNLARPAKVILLLPALYFTVIHALSVGSLRYRIPVEPPMAVLAGSWACSQGIVDGPTRRKSG